MKKKILQEEKKLSLKKKQMVKIQNLSNISGGQIKIGGGIGVNPIDFNTGPAPDCMFPDQGSNPPVGFDPTKTR